MDVQHARGLLHEHTRRTETQLAELTFSPRVRRAAAARERRASAEVDRAADAAYELARLHKHRLAFLFK
jgi:hypothetical protein